MTERNLETTCRRILGQAKWDGRFTHLSPGQIMEACAMLDEGWPPDIVEEAVFILRRYFWFKQVGIEVAPWGLREEHWAELITRAPWGGGKQLKQLSLF